MKRRFKKWRHIKSDIRETWWQRKKMWEETRACRENFKVETKRENILRVSEFYETFTITDLQFMCVHITCKFVTVNMKMWWDIIVWNSNKNIGLILILFNSSALTSIAFICWYWYSQNILNLTQLQTNLYLYIYISGTILRLTKSDCVFHPFGLILDSDWVLSDTKSSLIWCSNPFKQLKVLGVLWSFRKVIGDLGFLNYNQIYLLGINKTYSPLYNIYQFPTKLVRRAG